MTTGRINQVAVRNIKKTFYGRRAHYKKNMMGCAHCSDVRYALKVDHQYNYNIFCDKINTNMWPQRYFVN